MPEMPKTKRYDLEDRTFEFAKEVRSFVGTEIMKIFGAILEKSKIVSILIFWI